MAGEILAAQIAERSLAVIQIPVTELRHPTSGIPIIAAETADAFNFDLTTNVLLLQGEVTGAETETSAGMFQYTLPPNYVAGGDVKLRLKVNNLGAGTQTSCTITVTAYESDGNGGVGGNLGPGDDTHAAKENWYTKDFVINASGLVPGDTLNIVISVTNIATGAALVWTCDEVSMLVDIQG